MFGADNAILDDARGENMEYTESPIMTDFYGAAWGLQLVPPHDLRGITCAPDGCRRDAQNPTAFQSLSVFLYDYDTQTTFTQTNM